MASHQLVGRYEAYKTRSDAFVSWLTGAAANVRGTLHGIIKSLDTVAAQQSTDPETTPVRSVTVRELLQLADIVASAQPPPHLPPSLLSSLEYIIAKRTESNKWYSSQALVKDSKLARENESHRFFILVLQKVHGILKGVKQDATLSENAGPQPPPSKKKKKTKACRDTLENIFDLLDLEEPGDGLEYLGNPGPKPAKTSASSVEARFKLEEEQEDQSAFKTWCFLQDLDDVREYVKSSWQEYGRGELSFTAVSSLTATAFGLLHDIDNEFESPFGSNDWLKLIDYLGIGYFVRGKAVWMHPDPSRKTDEPRMPNPGVNIVNLLCPVAFECLLSWKSSINGICHSKQRLKKTGKTQQAQRDSTTQAEFNPLCETFLRLVGEIHPLACHSQTPDSHLWMVTSCQIVLDTNAAFSHQQAQGPDQLHEKGALTIQIGTDLMSYEAESGRKPNDVRSGIALLKRAVNTAERLVETLPSEASVSSWSKEAALPATAGERLVNISIANYKMGCALANHGSFVLSMAHLYKGLRAMGVLKATWADMEFVLSCFGSENNKSALVAKESGVWDGEKRDMSVRHYQLALGAPATEVLAASKKQAKEDKEFRVEARSIRIMSPFLRALSDYQDSGRSSLPMARVLGPDLHALASGEVGPKMGKKAQSTSSQLRTRFKATVLLETMKRRWVHDEPTLNFNFTGFMISCARFLDDLASRPGDIQGFGRDDPRDFHTTLVQHILLAPPHHVVIRDTADLLRAHVEKAGKIFTKAANDQSSHRIPKSLRPVAALIEQANVEAWDNVRCMLDYANAHHSVTHGNIAVYHPRIVPEVDSENSSRLSATIGAETDPNRRFDPYTQGQAFGSTFPRAINEEARRNMEADGSAWVASRLRMMRWHLAKHTAGECGIGDEALLDVARQISGFQLAKFRTRQVQDGKVDRTSAVREEWCFKVPFGAEQRDRDRYIDATSAFIGEGKELYRNLAHTRWVPWPLEAYMHYDLRGGEGSSQDVDAIIERCAHAMYDEMFEPDVAETLRREPAFLSAFFGGLLTSSGLGPGSSR